GVYAAGVAALAGSAGLLEGNAISGNAGVGLFLDDASAALGGNSWAEIGLDLLVQGEACLTPRADYEEAPIRSICPEWDEPACDLEFSLTLEAADVVQSRALPPVPTPMSYGGALRPRRAAPPVGPRGCDGRVLGGQYSTVRLPHTRLSEVSPSRPKSSCPASTAQK
ncbi:MAG: hypothetical protein ABIO70_08170, partial [Pseudomonadota bacterium]